jgi:hypothetical protein
MNEEHLKRFVEMLNVEFQASLASLPTPPCEFKTEGDKTVLLYRHYDSFGDLEVRFHSSEVLDKVAKEQAQHLVKQVLESGFNTDKDRYKFADFPAAKGADEKWPPFAAIWFKMYFAHLLGNNLALILRQTAHDAALVTAAHTLSIQTRAAHLMSGVRGLKITGLNESLGQVVSEAEKAKRELLEGYLAALSPDPHFERIGAHYQALYGVWSLIKKIFDEYGKPTWRDMASAHFRGKILAFDVPFEDAFNEVFVGDLMARIEDDLSELTKGEQGIIIERGGIPTPSNIAIEHAARLCGAWKYQHSQSWYFRKAKLTDGNGEEAVSKNGESLT